MLHFRALIGLSERAGTRHLAGPIGLPLAWLSRRFSRLAKIGLTAGFVLLTVVLPIVLVWYWCDVAIHPLVEALGR